MATTFHVVNFKNKTLDMFTGVSAATTPFGFVNLYNGAQPADPSVAPGGAVVFATLSQAPNVNTKMGSSGGGISQLNTPTPPTTPSGASGVAALTFARINTTGQQPIIDTPVSLSGGGGGVILDTLTSVAGVGPTLTALGFKMPSTLGTILLSASCMDRLVDMWAGGSSVTPNFGNITGGSSTLSFYTGAAPASADLPATGTLVATYNMTATNLWAAAAGGAAALSGAGPTVLANGTGTAAYFRFVKNNGLFTFTMQGSVGTAATDIIVNTVALTSGVTNVQITDATITI
jgi:hypothetical protein